MSTVKKFTDVLNEIRNELKNDFKVTDQMFIAMRQRVDSLNLSLPVGSNLIPVDDLWLDYSVQREAKPKHILKIMQGYDPRLHGPANTCQVGNDPKCLVYDGQQRSLARALLGFDTVPAIVIHTNDSTFPSYAFEVLNETGVEQLLPPDLHRNALTRYALGVRDVRSTRAHMMQEQFNKNNIDLEVKSTRYNPKKCGSRPFFFSHFAYGIKAIEFDSTGTLLSNILHAITKGYPNDSEVNQDLFIGLFELHRLDKDSKLLPEDWMVDVIKHVAKVFPKSTMTQPRPKSLIKQKAEMQLEHISPGRSWSAPSVMANFIREIYMYAGGTISLPYHGPGSLMQIATNPAPGLISNTLSNVNSIPIQMAA